MSWYLLLLTFLLYGTLQMFPLAIIYFYRNQSPVRLRIPEPLIHGGIGSVFYSCFILAAEFSSLLNEITSASQIYWTISFISPVLLILPHILRGWRLYLRYSPPRYRTKFRKFATTFFMRTVMFGCLIINILLICLVLPFSYDSSKGNGAFPTYLAFCCDLTLFWAGSIFIFVKIKFMGKIDKILLESQLVNGGIIMCTGIVIGVILTQHYAEYQPSWGHQLHLSFIFLVLCFWIHVTSVISPVLDLILWFREDRRLQPEDSRWSLSDTLENVKSRKSRSMHSKISQMLEAAENSESRSCFSQSYHSYHCPDEDGSNSDSSSSKQHRNIRRIKLSTSSEQKKVDWTLDKIFSTPQMLKQFRLFAEEHYCQEMVTFASSVLLYENLWKEETKDPDMEGVIGYCPNESKKRREMDGSCFSNGSKEKKDGGVRLAEDSVHNEMDCSAFAMGSLCQHATSGTGFLHQFLQSSSSSGRTLSARCNSAPCLDQFSNSSDLYFDEFSQASAAHKARLEVSRIKISAEMDRLMPGHDDESPQSHTSSGSSLKKMWGKTSMHRIKLKPIESAPNLMVAAMHSLPAYTSRGNTISSPMTQRKCGLVVSTQLDIPAQELLDEEMQEVTSRDGTKPVQKVCHLTVPKIDVPKGSKAERPVETSSTPPTARRTNQLKDVAAIYEQYVRPGAPDEVNISDQSRQNLAAWLSEPKRFYRESWEVRVKVFQELRSEVWRLLNTNLLQNFLDSKYFDQGLPANANEPSPGINVARYPSPMMLQHKKYARSWFCCYPCCKTKHRGKVQPDHSFSARKNSEHKINYGSKIYRKNKVKPNDA